jgi:hypothetical protein
VKYYYIDCLLFYVWVYALIFKVRLYMVTPELLDLPATWIPDGKATGVSSITLQLRGSISDNFAPANPLVPAWPAQLGVLTSASRSLKVNFRAACFLAFFTHHQTVQPRHLICPLRFVLAQSRDHPIGRLRFSVAERKYKCSIRAGCAFFRLRRRCHMSGTYHCDSITLG